MKKDDAALKDKKKDGTKTQPAQGGATHPASNSAGGGMCGLPGTSCKKVKKRGLWERWER